MYLPKGIEPNRLIHHACLAPESLLRYVLEWQEANHASFGMELAQFFRELSEKNTLRGSTLEKEGTPSSDTSVSSWKSPYELWKEFYAEVHPLQDGCVFMMDVDKDNRRPILSISWVEVLFSLEELLQHPTKGPLGWLGLCLLPLVKMYSPAVFEFLIGKVYRVLQADTDLHEKAFYAEKSAKTKVLNRSTFNLLFISRMNSLSLLYDGLRDHLDLRYLSTLNKSRYNVKLSGLPEDAGIFSNLVQSQLALRVPASRNDLKSIRERVAPTYSSGSYGVYFDLYRGVAYATPSTSSNLTILKSNTASSRSLAYCDKDDPLYPLRHDVFYILLEHILKCSLKRNREFLNHVIYTLNLVIGYRYKDNIAVREELLTRFMKFDSKGNLTYWCTPSTQYTFNVYDELTSYTTSWIEHNSTTSLPDSPTTLTDIALYTVDISDFLASYGTEEVAVRQKTDNADKLQLELPSVSLLKSYIWTFLPRTEVANPLMIPPRESRNSKIYLSAYTYSLALAIGTWRGAASTIRKLFPIDESTQPDTVNFISLVNDSGVSSLIPTWEETSTGVLKEKRCSAMGQLCTTTIDIPQYLIFLTQFAFLGTLQDGILSTLDSIHYKRSTYKDIFNFSYDNSYADFIRHLRITIFPDIFYYKHIYDTSAPEFLYVPYLKNATYYEGIFNGSLLKYDDRVVSIDVPKALAFFRRHTERDSRYTKQRLFIDRKPSTIKRINREGKLGRKDLILPLTFKGEDGLTLTVKMFKRKYTTYYILPWKELYSLAKIEPPIPVVVYQHKYNKRKFKYLESCTPEDRVEEGWGLYWNYLDHIRDSNPKHTWESIVAFWNQNFDKENQKLIKGVAVKKDHGYAFSAAFLRNLRDSDWTYDVKKSINPDDEEEEVRSYRSLSLILPSFMEFLNQNANMSVKNALIQDRDQQRELLLEQKTKKRKQAIANLKEGRSAGIKDDSRLRFTQEDDDNIRRYYRIGMTQEDRIRLQKCVLHNWPNIQYRANYLCNKLIKSGVKDPNLLPIMRVTKKVKQAIAAG